MQGSPRGGAKEARVNLRLLAAGVLAGVVMFLWGAVSHVALQLGDAGMENLPADSVIVPVLKENVPRAGFYYFPTMDEDGGDAAYAEFERKHAEGPRGVLVFHPEGAVAMSPWQLGKELLTNVATCLLAGILLWCAADRLGSYAKRVAFVAVLGLLTWLAVDVPYWNWYGFPETFTLAQLPDSVIGFALAGCVLGALVKR